ncbi:sodium-solute symporter [Vibrio ishigakensis]|uniref:Sodium-solute symporter n=1 Tax=Vibrio ishigakensis TaxID=1481914 RepID=A0A0B8Q5C6_9VIBR|nr:sodium-solute symporter [Vibrio ishigakensis]
MLAMDIILSFINECENTKVELNTLIVAVYFLFLIAIGWMFRSFTSTTSDYFRGGGNMLW